MGEKLLIIFFVLNRIQRFIFLLFKGFINMRIFLTTIFITVFTLSNIHLAYANHDSPLNRAFGCPRPQSVSDCENSDYHCCHRACRGGSRGLAIAACMGECRKRIQRCIDDVKAREQVKRDVDRKLQDLKDRFRQQQNN